MVFDRWHTKDIQTPTQHVFLLFSFIISSKGFIILSLFLSLCYYVSIIVSITGYFQLLCNIIAMTTQLFPGTAWNSLFPSNITVWALSWSIQHPSSFFLCVCRRCCSISFVLGKIQQNSTPDSNKWFQLTDQTIMFVLILSKIWLLSSKSWNCLNDGANFQWQSSRRYYPKEHLVHVSLDSAFLFLDVFAILTWKKEGNISENFDFKISIQKGFTQLISDIMWSDCFAEISKSIPSPWQLISSRSTVMCY